MKEIVFENVCKSYGKTQIVNNLNLTIKEGERLILLDLLDVVSLQLLEWLQGWKI